MKRTIRHTIILALFLLGVGPVHAAQPVINWGFYSAGSQYVPMSVDSSGNVNVNVIAGGATSSTGNAASGATDSGNPVKTGSVYHSAPITVTDGQRVDDQANANGYKLVVDMGIHAGADYTNGTQGITPKVLVATTYSPKTYFSSQSGSQVVSANVSNAACQVVSITYASSNATVRYLWVTNATTAPANALASSDSSVVEVLAVYQNAPQVFSFTGAGKNFGTGGSFGMSTSATSYTAATASETMVSFLYF